MPAPPSGVIFPLPLPFAGVFARFPLESSSRFRKRVAHRRLLHLVVMALNFLHADFVPIPLSGLQRPLNAAQRSLVAHIGRHLKAFGASVGVFCLSDSGRRNPQLLARLSELTSFLSTASASTGDSYADRSGTVVPMHNDAHPGLDPFKSLDVSRLRLSGRGLWNPLPYLPDELYMALAEPSSLAHKVLPPDSFVPVWTRESVRETTALAHLWDDLGLLRLSPADVSSADSFRLARAFNCYKSTDKDRMIIDRRGQNWAEARLAGPSLFIPVGPMIGMLEVNPKTQTVHCAATDRKDFYHQIGVPDSKCLTNALGPALPAEAVRHTSAFRRLIGGHSFGTSSLMPGSFCSERSGGTLLFDPNHYLVCFGAIAQGDHLGVELGTAAHSAVLEEGGLLPDETRLCSNRPFKGESGAQGLVIDDFFSLSIDGIKGAPPAACLEHLTRAKKIYADQGLQGSDDKDICGEQFAKIAGAEINSSPFVRSLGLVTVSCPASKRVALSSISLEASRFSHVTDGLLLSLVGSWTSAGLFRRPFMSVFSSIYDVCPSSSVKPGKQTLRPLPRPAAQELVLASLLSPLASCDLAAPFGDRLYATDASELKGGYVWTEASIELLRPLWRTASKKGGYSRLLAREEALLARFSDQEPFELRMLEAPPGPAAVTRPLAYYFDVLEVGQSSGQVSSLLSGWGRSVGPVLRASDSPAYGLSELRTLEWVIHLLHSRKLKFLLISPPAVYQASACTSGAGAGFALGGGRSSRPRGLARRLLAAHRCLLLLFAASRCKVPALLIQVGLSTLVRSSVWLRLGHLGASSSASCFCAFGAPCCKDCKFLAFGLDLSPLSVPCCNATRSACPRCLPTDRSFLPFRLARALACEIDRTLRRVADVSAELRVHTEGLESAVVNDVVLSSLWKAGSDWCWRATAHINILEAASILRLLRDLAPSGPLRVVILVDSSVAFHACAKGRSPSRGLRPVLRKIAALCISAGIYPAFHYVPTRINPGDCPTRDLVLPCPAEASFWTSLSTDELYEALALPKLRRWAANWVRLALLCCGPPPSVRPGLGWRSFHVASRLFDSSLGFPGEGPFFRVLLFWAGFSSCCSVPRHVLRPRHSADEKRSQARSALVLAPGRPVEKVTQQRREKLLSSFVEWLAGQGVEFEELLDLSLQSTKQLNSWLVCYGRQLFEAGWPYSHYSEVINAVSSREAGLRRCLQPAWDLAFAWLREEPHSHHVALPWQILLALIATSLIWG